MNKIKKIISVIVVTMFLSALTVNYGLIRKASASIACPGWDGYSSFCGWDEENQDCRMVEYCTSTCLC